MRTWRSRARTWKKVTSWLVMFKGKSYSTQVSEMLDYIIFLQQEGATQGQVDGVCAALSVIEDAGQVPASQKISEHRLWLQSVKSLMADLDNGAKSVRWASPLSVAMVLALEVIFTDSEQPMYTRARMADLGVRMGLHESLGFGRVATIQCDNQQPRSQGHVDSNQDNRSWKASA